MPAWIRKETQREETGKIDYGRLVLTGPERLLLGAEAVLAAFLTVWLCYRSPFGLPAGLASAFLLLSMKKRELLQKQQQTVLYHFRDFIFSLNAAFRAGYSLGNAFSSAAKDLEALYGARDLTVRETKDIAAKLGYRMPAADLLEDWGRRSGVEDIRQFAQMTAISAKSGGRIIRMLSDSWKTICERIDTRKETESLLASKLYERKLVSIMPMVIIIYLRLSFSGMMASLYGNLPGVLIMTACLAAYWAAVLWSRKIVEIEV